ncbi:MAG: type II secretion system protein [Patescibacteria group bacterium]|nr:MAG: type II secretion system protein [Patescibacteria group bacterium]
MFYSIFKKIFDLKRLSKPAFFSRFSSVRSSSSSSSSAFTLVELLVVIAIIGVLTTVSVVYFNSSRVAARDAKRLADIKQIQIALKLYYQDYGEYPQTVTPGGAIASGSKNYLLRVPSNPTPRNDGDCPDEDYQYQVMEGGQRYSLNFCLSSKVADLKYPGIKVGTTNGILDCKPGYMGIVGSTALDTNDFCVMKYEAKCLDESGEPVVAEYGTGYDDDVDGDCINNGGAITSAPLGEPIISLDLNKARYYCELDGSRLISNPEWMTIARDAQSNGLNEEGARKYMPRGNFHSQAVLNAENEYVFTNEFDGNNFFDRRTLKLLSGGSIWDLAGNVAELADSTCVSGTGAGQYPVVGPSYWSTVLADPNYAYAVEASGPTWLDGYDSSMGNSGWFTSGCSSTGNIFIRGGDSFNGTDGHDGYVGIYYLDLENNSSYKGKYLGFRCVH